MDLNRRGLIHVYTGNGKGKTTAALGLALRAAGQGMGVRVIQFLKAANTGEIKSARHLPGLDIQVVSRPVLVAREGEIDQDTIREWGSSITVFPPGEPPEWLKAEVSAGLSAVKEALHSGDSDMVVLDELNVAMHYELVSVPEVIDLIESRSRHVEVVVTGRNAPPELLEAADLVTEMVERKHYFSQGVSARRGIEF